MHGYGELQLKQLYYNNYILAYWFTMRFHSFLQNISSKLLEVELILNFQILSN